MDDKINKIHDKLDLIVDKIHSIDKTLERNTTSLEYHISRTNALEAKIEPLEKHAAYASGIVKFLLFISGIAALIKTIKG